MNRSKNTGLIEIALSAALAVSIFYGIGVRYIEGADAFRHYVREEGLSEYATSMFLLAGSIISFYRAFTCCRGKRRLPVLTWSALAILFFFTAGEEISWGQRIFSVESGEFFLRYNKQEETNLHNLVVGGQDLNMIIFSRLIIFALLFYFVILPLLVRKPGFFRNLVVATGLPLPTLRHIIIMAVSTALIAVINLSKGSELNELAFAVVFFLIFLNPRTISRDQF